MTVNCPSLCMQSEACVCTDNNVTMKNVDTPDSVHVRAPIHCTDIRVISLLDANSRRTVLNVACVPRYDINTASENNAKPTPTRRVMEVHQ